jgi:hypothetical protein
MQETKADGRGVQATEERRQQRRARAASDSRDKQAAGDSVEISRQQVIQ